MAAAATPDIGKMRIWNYAPASSIYLVLTNPAESMDLIGSVWILPNMCCIHSASVSLNTCRSDFDYIIILRMTSRTFCHLKV